MTFENTKKTNKFSLFFLVIIVVLLMIVFVNNSRAKQNKEDSANTNIFKNILEFFGVSSKNILSSQRCDIYYDKKALENKTTFVGLTELFNVETEVRDPNKKYKSTIMFINYDVNFDKSKIDDFVTKRYKGSSEEEKNKSKLYYYDLLNYARGWDKVVDVLRRVINDSKTENYILVDKVYVNPLEICTLGLNTNRNFKNRITEGNGSDKDNVPVKAVIGTIWPYSSQKENYEDNIIKDIQINKAKNDKVIQMSFATSTNTSAIPNDNFYRVNKSEKYDILKWVNRPSSNDLDRVLFYNTHSEQFKEISSNAKVKRLPIEMSNKEIIPLFKRGDQPMPILGNQSIKDRLEFRIDVFNKRLLQSIRDVVNATDKTNIEIFLGFAYEDIYFSGFRPKDHLNEIIKRSQDTKNMKPNQLEQLAKDIDDVNINKIIFGSKYSDFEEELNNIFKKITSTDNVDKLTKEREERIKNEEDPDEKERLQEDENILIANVEFNKKEFKIPIIKDLIKPGEWSTYYGNAHDLIERHKFDLYLRTLDIPRENTNKQNVNIKIILPTGSFSEQYMLSSDHPDNIDIFGNIGFLIQSIGEKHDLFPKNQINKFYYYDNDEIHDGYNDNILPTTPSVSTPSVSTPSVTTPGVTTGRIYPTNTSRNVNLVNDIIDAIQIEDAPEIFKPNSLCNKDNTDIVDVKSSWFSKLLTVIGEKGDDASITNMPTLQLDEYPYLSYIDELIDAFLIVNHMIDKNHDVPQTDKNYHYMNTVKFDENGDNSTRGEYKLIPFNKHYDNK